MSPRTALPGGAPRVTPDTPRRHAARRPQIPAAAVNVTLALSAALLLGLFGCGSDHVSRPVVPGTPHEVARLGGAQPGAYNSLEVLLPPGGGIVTRRGNTFIPFRADGSPRPEITLSDPGGGDDDTDLSGAPAAILPDGRFVLPDEFTRGLRFYAPDGHYQATTAAPAGVPAGSWSQVRIGVTAEGRIVVMDGNLRRGYLFDDAGTLVARFGGFTSDPGGFVGTPGPLAAAPDGTFFVGDDPLKRVSHFRADGSFAGSFDVARGFDMMTVGPDGDVYISGYPVQGVRQYTPDGTLRQEWPDAPAIYNEISYLVGADAAGQFYFWSQSGIVRGSLAGGATRPIGHIFGRARGEIGAMHAFAVSPFGGAFAMDTGADSLLSFDPTGASAMSWSTQSDVGDGIRDPGGISFDRFGQPLLMDLRNHWLLRATPAGSLERLFALPDQIAGYEATILEVGGGAQVLLDPGLESLRRYAANGALLATHTGPFRLADPERSLRPDWAAAAGSGDLWVAARYGSDILRLDETLQPVASLSLRDFIADDTGPEIAGLAGAPNGDLAILAALDGWEILLLDRSGQLVRRWPVTEKSLRGPRWGSPIAFDRQGRFYMAYSLPPEDGGSHVRVYEGAVP